MRSLRSLGVSRRGRRGFTLIEVTIALALITVLVLALISALIVTVRVSREAKDLRTAHQVVQRQFELMRRVDFTSVFDEFDGQVGAVDSLWANGAYSVDFLTEAEAQVALGESIDLDGNDVEDENTPPSADMELLVVRVTVEWTSSAGHDRTYAQETLLYPTGGID